MKVWYMRQTLFYKRKYFQKGLVISPKKIKNLKIVMVKNTPWFYRKQKKAAIMVMMKHVEARNLTWCGVVIFWDAY